jgi:hypothetical protein
VSTPSSSETTHVEWQAAEGSWTLHAIDTTRPAWHNPDGSRRQSGPRSLCGRYPQRNAETPWWALPVAEAPERPGFNLTFCADCAEVVTPPEPRSDT